MTLATIRSTALKFQNKIRRRNIREYVGLAIGTVMYCAFIWFLPGLLTKLGAVLTLIGMYFCVYQIQRDGSSEEVPVDSSAGDCLEFHRRQLIRQRDMLRRVGPWHIGPIMPGFVLFFAGVWVSDVHNTSSAVIMAISGICLWSRLLAQRAGRQQAAARTRRPGRVATAVRPAETPEWRTIRGLPVAI